MTKEENLNMRELLGEISEVEDKMEVLDRLMTMASESDDGLESQNLGPLASIIREILAPAFKAKNEVNAFLEKEAKQL